MNRLDESLNAVSRLRATVSVEDRVMAAVRAQAARRPIPYTAHTARQIGALIAVMLAAVLADATWARALWTALPWGSSPAFAHGFLKALSVVLELISVGERSMATLLRGLAVAVTSPLAQVATVGSVLLLVAFIAVNRPRRRATARGVR